MRTMYDQSGERTNGKILYLDDYRIQPEGEECREEVSRGRRADFPMCGSDLLNLGMVVMTLAATGMILSGL